MDCGHGRIATNLTALTVGSPAFLTAVTAGLPTFLCWQSVGFHILCLLIGPLFFDFFYFDTHMTFHFLIYIVSLVFQIFRKNLYIFAEMTTLTPRKLAAEMPPKMLVGRQDCLHKMLAILGGRGRIAYILYVYVYMYVGRQRQDCLQDFCVCIN